MIELNRGVHRGSTQSEGPDRGRGAFYDLGPGPWGGAGYEIFYGPNREINVAAAIILAISLFVVRRHYRTTYGAIEVVFGVFVLWNTWKQGRGGFSAGFSSGFDAWNWTIILLQVFGAVYVIIRGLDNIDQGSKGGQPTHPMVALFHRGCQRVISIL